MVVFDNIIFNLQHSGGISVVWSELLRRAEADPDLRARYIEYNNAEQNLARAELSPAADRIMLRPGNLMTLRRISNPSLRDLREPFVFHSSYYRTCSNPMARCVTTVHDFTSELMERGLRSRAHRWQKANAIRKSDRVICVSENTRADLLCFLPDVDPAKVSVVYNGVSPDYRVIDTSGLKLPFGGDYFLFVGSRAHYKNFQPLVRLLSRLSCNLVVVGEALNEAERHLLESTLGSGRYAVEVGVDNKRLNELYNGARALIYPSEYEGFGIPVLEAQRAGCPVIAQRVSSLPEVAGDSPLLISELSEGEFRRCLDLLGNPADVRAITEAGKANSERFSWDKTYRHIKQIYSELLS